MGKKSIKQQLFYAINTCHSNGKGRKKHQDKIEGNNKDKSLIYSGTEADALRDFATNFGKWIKEKHPEHWKTEMKDMPVEIANEYFGTKKDCSQNTINSYKARWDKLLRCGESTFKGSDFGELKYIEVPLSERDPAATLRDITFDRGTHQAAIEKMKFGSGARKGNVLSGILGTRVTETKKIKYKDIDLNKGTVFIQKGKGGKSRTIKLSFEDIQILKKELFNGQKYNENQEVCGCSTEAIQKGLTRAFERLDKENRTNLAHQLKDKKTSIHATRKMVATEKYNGEVKKATVGLIVSRIMKDNPGGATKSELINKVFGDLDGYKKEYLSKKDILDIENKSWSKISVFLGHGPNRPELKKVYIITDATKILTLSLQ